jgi:glycosyltransferase involved in cell wall biosynthesis
MAPVQVLHILWSTQLGGISTLVRNLSVAQLRGGETGACVYSARVDTKGTESFREQFIPLTNGGFRNGRDIRPLGYKRLNHLIEQHDILHFHAFHPMLFRLAMKSGKRIIYTEHGNFGIGRKADIGERINAWFKSKLVNRYASAITFNSSFTQDIYLKMYGKPKAETLVIPNGIPFQPALAPKTNSIFTVACIGRLATVKRFERAIESFQKAAIEPAQLIIMGDGPEKEKLMESAAKLGVTGRVVFYGQGDARELLASSDLCIVSSQGEAFGLVALEAYQQGRKVLAFSDGGGVCELIRQEDPSAIVDYTDQMAEKIRYSFLNNAVINSVTAVEKRHIIASQYSIEQMAVRFNSLYTT